MTSAHKKQGPKDDAAVDSTAARRRSGTRRIEQIDPVSVPKAPRLPSLTWAPFVDQDQIPTQPEHEVPGGEGATLPAPPAPPSVDRNGPADDANHDTIPSPSPED